VGALGLRADEKLIYIAGPERDGFTFDRVFDTGTQQNEIFDWGVKGIVDGKSILGLLSACMVAEKDRRDDGLQWNAVLLWSNRIRKDI
jgi:hypothetical protein